MPLPITMRQVRYVCEVARHGSINAASKSLRISQSSIIAAIAIAEQEMGARLFDRRPARGVVTTPAGERFLVSARNLLAAEVEFGRTVEGLASGPPPILRIGCFEPFGALFMAEMLRRYADAMGTMDTIEVQLLEGHQQELVEWCNTGLVDLIVTYDVGPSLPEGVTRICKIPTHALLSADDPLALRQAVSIAELAERPMVLLDLPYTSSYLLALFDALATRPRISFHTRSYDSVRAAVSCGFGVALLNMRPIGKGSPDRDGIVRRPLIDDLAPPCLIVADMYGAHKPHFVRLFIETIKAFFLDHGPGTFAVSTPEREAGLIQF